MRTKQDRPVGYVSGAAIRTVFDQEECVKQLPSFESDPSIDSEYQIRV
jgi:hypothetical protein